MTHPLHDTIAAPITGAQRAAVAIVRVSGTEAWNIASGLFKPLPALPEVRRAYYGQFAHGDDGFVLLFAEGASFTGESCAEFHVHGSPSSVRALMEHCLRRGARMAEPGEFTYRAFMNGRIDLTEAEGVRETIESQTQRQFRQSQLLREGRLRERISALRDQVFGVLARVEASVDFSEEIGELDRVSAVSELRKGVEECETLLATHDRGRLVREGVTVAIVGRPNAGKSSLLNAILKSDRAIVTEIAGTTRDTVEEWAEVNGQMVRFMDTAGLRDTDDVVERIGVDRALRAADSADEIWYLYDAAAGWTTSDDEELRQLSRPVRILANKSDLGARAPQGHTMISALTGAGIPELLADLVRTQEELEFGPSINSRHLPLLEQTLRAIQLAIDTLSEEVPDDLASVHLRDAVMRLGEITGETANEDMVARIFRDFCIGK